jgi:hypothetical protein
VAVISTGAAKAIVVVPRARIAASKIFVMVFSPVPAFPATG